MMTREVFVLKKAEIDERMHKSKLDEKKKIHAINEEYEQRMKQEYLAYIKRRQVLMDERDLKRLEVEHEQKNLRRDLYAEDCELVALWRSQLNSIPPPSMEEGCMKEVKYEHNQVEAGGCGAA